jgi:hypothetical protein
VTEGKVRKTEPTLCWSTLPLIKLRIRMWDWVADDAGGLGCATNEALVTDQ